MDSHNSRFWQQGILKLREIHKTVGDSILLDGTVTLSCDISKLKEEIPFFFFDLTYRTSHMSDLA